MHKLLLHTILYSTLFTSQLSSMGTLIALNNSLADISRKQEFEQFLQKRFEAINRDIQDPPKGTHQVALKGERALAESYCRNLLKRFGKDWSKEELGQLYYKLTEAGKMEELYQAALKAQ